MHLCSPCHLTSPLEVVGHRRMVKVPTGSIRGQSNYACFFQPVLHLPNTWERPYYCPSLPEVTPPTMPTSLQCMDPNWRWSGSAVLIQSTVHLPLCSSLEVWLNLFSWNWRPKLNRSRDSFQFASVWICHARAERKWTTKREIFSQSGW